MIDTNKVGARDVNYAVEKKNKKGFGAQKVDFSDSPLFFPKKFEKLFLLIYFLVLPYLAGLLFLFLYISNANTETFLAINADSSIYLIWTMGYEIISIPILLYVIYKALTHSLESKGKAKSNSHMSGGY